MKNIIKLGVFALFSFLVMTACNSLDGSDLALGAMPTSDQLDFTTTPTTAKANVIGFANTSKVKGIATWDLGNGTKAKGDSCQASYPFKGNYTIILTLYTSGGSISLSKTITIAHDDMSLLNTPMYTSLTGGATMINGKTWVFDQYHAGNFGVGPMADTSPSWWSSPAGGKTRSSLYTQEFTFTQVGVKMTWKNNGYVYSNNPGVTALAAMGYSTSVKALDGDFDIAYIPKASYTFALNEVGKTITLSDGAFFGHYAGTSTYQILSLTDNELYIKAVSTVEPGNGWWYRFIPKELNVKPLVPMQAPALSENFEGLKSKVSFVLQDMGLHSIAGYSNPAPTGINTSSNVFLYEKSSAFYSNISYTAVGYKFDLSTINKVHMKVFIPSYNDYTTVNATAGSWITNTQLQAQVAVKLQNNDLSGTAYTTQKEIDMTNLAKDKWLDLVFDFSSVSARQDFDKIVIQFGSEGQVGTGIFFFDDFTFNN